MLALAAAIWSLTSIATGWFNSFAILVIMRVILGSAMAATDPTAFSIISDKFKKSQLTMANSIWIAAPFLGGGLSSGSVIIT